MDNSKLRKFMETYAITVTGFLNLFTGIIYLGSNLFISFYHPEFASRPEVLYNSLWPGILFISNSVVAFSINKEKKRLKMRIYQCTSILSLFICMLMFSQGCKDIFLQSSTSANENGSPVLILLTALMILLSSAGGLVSCSSLYAIAYALSTHYNQARMNAVLPSVFITSPATAIPSTYPLEASFTNISPPPPYESFFVR